VALYFDNSNEICILILHETSDDVIFVTLPTKIYSTAIR